jgi:hypothetical protein
MLGIVRARMGTVGLSWFPSMMHLGSCGFWRQVEEDVLDDTVANRDALPDPGTRVMKRGAERLSLTARRVLRVKNIMGLQR